MTASDLLIRTLSVALGIALAGCLSTPEVPEIAPLPEAPPPGFEESLEATIEDSLPRVSYAPDSPDYLGPLVHASREGDETMNREVIQGWIRRLESLDGDRAVVCRSTPDDVFGYCSFPDAGDSAELEPSAN